MVSLNRNEEENQKRGDVPSPDELNRDIQRSKIIEKRESPSDKK
jgi:hypothetical protein